LQLSLTDQRKVACTINRPQSGDSMTYEYAIRGCLPGIRPDSCFCRGDITEGIRHSKIERCFEKLQAIRQSSHPAYAVMTGVCFPLPPSACSIIEDAPEAVKEQRLQHPAPVQHMSIQNVNCGLIGGESRCSLLLRGTAATRDAQQPDAWFRRADRVLVAPSSLARGLGAQTDREDDITMPHAPCAPCADRQAERP